MFDQYSEGHEDRNRNGENGGRFDKLKGNKLFKNLKGQWAKLGKYDYSPVIGLLAVSIIIQVLGHAVGLQWLFTMGQLIGWGASILWAYQFWKSAKRRWPNVSAIIAWSASLLLSFLLVLLFWQGAHIYAQLGLALAQEQGVIAIGDLGASRVVNWGGLFGHALAPILRGLAFLLQGMALTPFALGGILLYLVITIAEIAPMVIRSSPKLMQDILNSFEKYKKRDARGDESKAVAKLIKAHNNYFEDFLNMLDIARIVAYVIDTIICLFFAPTIDGGYGMWNSIKFTFGFGSIDWLNVLRIFITLFLFAQVCWLMIQVRKGYKLFSGQLK